jgi:hypothetical protein
LTPILSACGHFLRQQRTPTNAHCSRSRTALIIAGFSSAEQHQRLIDPARATLPPLFEFVTPMPYTALQQMLDDAHPWG